MIAERIKEKRNESKLTQEELGSEIGCTRQFVHSMERGLKVPSTTMLIRIADILNCSTDYLLGREVK
ncbi:MAG: helix-turn-helix domain-containing protein [Firmicutes bacterium]|nr:helix-turn-helix domain-containing protein [Bacillota bacterium]